MIAAGIISGVGAAFQALSAGAAAKQNAAIADFNKQVALRNRQTALAVADAEARDKVREGRRQIGSIRAAYGASGLDLSGSPLDVLEDTVSEQMTDVRRTQYKGELKAAGYSDEAANYQMKSDLYKQEASFAPVTAMLGFAKGVAGGFASSQASMLRV